MNCVPPGRSSFVFDVILFWNDICRQGFLPAVYGLGGGEDGLGDFLGGGLGVSGGVNCGVFSLNCKRTDWKTGGEYGNMIMENYVQKRGASACMLLFVTISSTSWTI